MDVEEYFDIVNDIDLVNIIEEQMPGEYHLRERIDHFNYWDDVEFFNRFRLSKQSVLVVLNEIEGQIANPTDR